MWLKKKIKQYREILLYLFFGGLTTLVNAIFYFLSSWGLSLDAWLSSVIAWLFAVLFAFFTNKIIVFKSKAKSGSAVREVLLFFGARLASLLLNTAVMLVFVDLLALNEPIFFVIGQIIVLVFNYIASKFLIFKRKEESIDE